MIHYEMEETFPVTREVLWDVVANTEHLNRSIGLPAVHFSPAISDQKGLYRIAEARANLMNLKWKEYPFEWIRPESYSVYREFIRGPFRWVQGGVKLYSEGNATRAVVFGDAEPNGVLGRLGARVGILGGIRKTLDFMREAVALQKKGNADYIPRSETRTPTNQSLLGQRLTRAQLMNESIANGIRKLLTEGTDEEVLGIQPLLIAMRFGEDPEEIVKALLSLVKHSVVSLDWKLLCPTCRVPKARAENLADIPGQIHCDLCGITYDTNSANSIEMRFRIHPSIRNAVENIYCIGGPANTPHVLAQTFLKPGERKQLQISHEFPELRIRNIKTREIAEIPPNAAEVNAVFDGGWKLKNPTLTPTLSLPKRGEGEHLLTNLDLHNASERPLIVVIEDPELNRNVFTLARTLTLQQFRDMFSRELLAPGLSVSVESSAFLFTDLKDSTVMYERTGDANAYVAVRKHFDLLMAIIMRNRGAIVKTIGDAVMAVFLSEEDCLNAGLEICAHADDFQKVLQSETNKVIKVGIHSGQAILVNANDRMDYFGSTVNIAARVQGLSSGADMVMTDIFTLPHCQRVLSCYRFDKDIFETKLKGIENLFNVVRVTSVMKK
jgi:adenylate cyclase